MEALKILALLGLAACGRLDFSSSGDAASGPDAACLGTGAFADVQPVSAIDDADTQYGTFISPDGLAILWDQSNGTFDQLFMTQRSSRADAFPAGAPIPGAFPAGNASDPTITGDLLELYFSSDITDQLCLYRATRTSTAEPFTAPVQLVALCDGLATTGAAISADGLTLVYNSALDPVAEGDLYITVRPDRTSEFPAGKKLNGLPSSVGYAWLSRDRLRIWFEQEVGTEFKIATAQRISPSDDFSSVHDVTELDTGTGNGDPGLTLDESEIVFSSSRTGNYDIYTATRPCL